MIVDSHCHLNLIDLGEFNNDLNEVLQQAHHQGVEHFLCVCVDLEDYPQLEKIAQHHEHVSISVGVHPNSVMKAPVTTKMLCDLANNPKCIAIGETGLDYFRTEGFIEQEAQRQQFREHIQAAIACHKPLIIHTRQAIEDTLHVMK
jgi:TatD DNase family protein